MSAIKPVTSNNGVFFKSSFSNDGPSCVEVKFDKERVLIRDSKQNTAYVNAPDEQPTIIFPAAQWATVLDLTLAAKSGQVDSLTIDLRSDGGADLSGVAIGGDSVRLTYMPDEWDAFTKGVAGGEFDYR
ncbi:DUF397 domain-containing protein [Nocardia sp. 2YAB30]|uniref:DUF397 domain-containing protein n=1 Tax=unclassified Nocardia TaxID=2637762 RepID=UPI003F9E6A49